MAFYHTEFKKHGSIEHHVGILLEREDPFVLASPHRRPSADSVLCRHSTILIVTYDTTQQKKREWQYDNAEKYKEFLLEHNEGYLFVPGWRTITQEVYSLDTNKFETVTLSLSDHFRLNEYCYLPLTENRIDLNAVCRFVLSNKGYLDTVYGDIIKDGMTKNDFEEEFKALTIVKN